MTAARKGGAETATPSGVVSLALIENRLDELTNLSDAGLVAGIERWYSVSETAAFFGRSSQWLYDRLKKGKFTYVDGAPIEPFLVGDGARPIRRFNLELISEMALSLYRVGILKLPELQTLMRRVVEAGAGTFDPSAMYGDD